MHGLQGLQRVIQREPQVLQVDGPAGQQLRQAAVHQFEDQPTTLPHEVVDRHDVRVLQRCQELGFLPIPIELPRISQELLVDLLDRHVATQFVVASAVHGGVIAAGDGLQNLVAPGSGMYYPSLLNNCDNRDSKCSSLGGDTPWRTPVNPFRFSRCSSCSRSKTRR